MATSALSPRLVVVAAALSLACASPWLRGSGPRTVTWAGEGYGRVVANAHHTCVLDSGDHAHCYGGDNTVDPPMTPTPTEPLMALATSRRTACGIRQDGHALVCWGACAAEKCAPPDGRFDSLALHDDGGGCAWGSGSPVTCWGDQHFLHTAAPPVSLRGDAVLALVFGMDWGLLQRKDSSVAVFGRATLSDERFVGNDPALLALTASHEPRLAIGGSGATACTASLAGEAACVSYYGSLVPPDVSKPALAFAFSDPMGTMPACVLYGDDPRHAGRVSCTAGVKGHTPHLTGSAYTQIAAGDDHVCALSLDRRVTCEGLDRDGQVSGTGAWP